MITVLAGENIYALQAKLAEIKKEFIANYGNGGVEQYMAEQLGSQQLTGLLGGATLFAENRLVIVKNTSAYKQLAEKLIELLKTMPSEIHLLLIEDNLDKRTAFYKTLKKQAEFHEFVALDENSAVDWVLGRVNKSGGTISVSDARVLVYAVGPDQSRLNHEIAKLLDYDSSITKKTIELLVEPDPRDTVFQLLEYSLSGQFQKALEVLEGLERAHEDPFQTANMLIWQTHILAVVYSAVDLSESEVAKSAKLNPFVIRKTKNLVRSMNRNQLNRILDSVAQCDISLKTTSVDPWRAIEQTILAFKEE